MQEYWSGLPSPSPGDLSNPGIEPRSPAFQADSLPFELPGKPIFVAYHMAYLGEHSMCTREEYTFFSFCMKCSVYIC